MKKEIQNVIHVYMLLFIKGVLSNYNNVSSCPECEEKWKERANFLNCAIRNYHCILDTNGNTIETCITPNVISSNAVGCPMVQIIDGKAFLRADRTSCPPDNTFCPSTNHPRYSTNELYKYPICNVRGKERVTYKGQCCNPVVKYVNISVIRNETIPCSEDRVIECKKPVNHACHCGACLAVLGFFVFLFVLTITVPAVVIIRKKRQDKSVGFQYLIPKKSTKYRQRKRHFVLLQSIFNDDASELEKSITKLSCFENGSGRNCVLCDVASPLLYAAMAKKKTAFTFLIERTKFESIPDERKTKILHFCIVNNWQELLKENTTLHNEIYLPQRRHLYFVRKEDMEQNGDLNLDDRKDIISVCFWDEKSPQGINIASNSEEEKFYFPMKIRSPNVIFSIQEVLSWIFHEIVSNLTIPKLHLYAIENE